MCGVVPRSNSVLLRTYAMCVRLVTTMHLFIAALIDSSLAVHMYYVVNMHTNIPLSVVYYHYKTNRRSVVVIGRFFSQ